MKSNTNYRNLARQNLKNAKSELEGNSDSRLVYAALELRMAIEALTYDRVLAYQEEFPPNEFETWQPKKVMALLIEIDPFADQDSCLGFGRQDKVGIPAEKMSMLGSETVLNMSVIKDHYDALGSYLHIPTIKQSSSGKPTNYLKLRNRCDEIYIYIEKVISSRIFNITLGNFSAIECVECGAKVRKRISDESTELHAACYKCNATYKLKNKSKSEFEWIPDQQEVECANTDCKCKIVIWQHEFEAGRYWHCPECKGINDFTLCVRYQPDVGS